jgi:hypothetical protein
MPRTSGSGSHSNEQFRYNNALLIEKGVSWVLEQASKQSAGRITLHNTAHFLIDAEMAALQKARKWRIAPYNDYRKRFGLPPVSSFKELTGDEALAAELDRLYRNDINQVEFTIGLLAEARPSDAVLGELMTLMVGVDAFSQALTNPLLSSNVFSAGSGHDRPKDFYLKLVACRSSQLPATFDDLFQRYAGRWSERGSFQWRDELERFTVDLVFRWLLDMEVDADKVRTIYNNIFTNVFWRITRFFPGSVYSKSLRYYQELIQSIENSSGFQGLFDLAPEYGLMDRPYLAKQLAFLIGMNSYLGLQCLFKSIVGELSIRPEDSRSLLEQAAQAKPDQIWQGSLAAVDLFIMEVLRLHPPVFFIFGRATKDTTINSASGVFRIAVGELLMGVIPAAHSDDASFPEPSKFDPGRFRSAEQRKHLIWPRGLHDDVVRSNDRTCPGKDAAVAIARAFCVTLLTKAKWKMAAPVGWDKRWFSLNVAAPKGDLPVRFSPRL